MTGFDQLARALESPLADPLWMTGEMFVMVCIYLDLVRTHLVSGTSRRYVAATVVRTMLFPSIVIKMASAVLSVVEANYVHAGLSVAIGMLLILRWNQTRDEDSWWKGRGRKIGSWIRNSLTGRQTAPAAA